MRLLYAAQHYSDPIQIYGAIGGRLDQTLANISLLAHPTMVGRDVRLVQPNEEVWLVSDQSSIVGSVGDTVSLLPFHGDAVVRATTGLRWPLQNETLHFGRARGVSNEMVDTVASVEVSSGQLICVHMMQPAESSRPT